jgi:hypothetical protein
VLGSVEPFDYELANAGPYSKPNRGSDNEDVGVNDLLENLGPVITLTLVGGDAEGNVVVDDANGFAVDIEVTRWSMTWSIRA